MPTTNLDILNASIAADDGTILINRTTKAVNFPLGVVSTPVAYSASGAIAVPSGSITIHLTAAGVGVYTIVAPVAGTDDGKKLTIVTDTAQAHTLTSPVDGFNSKGASGQITWTATKGNSAVLEAYNGHWWVSGINGVTVT